MKENPEDAPEGKTFLDNMNPNSLEIKQSYLEPSLKVAQPGDRFQFERLGYFCVDSKYSTKEKLVFNRTVTLRDTWAKIAKSS